jgi:hypothetical protein
MGFGLPQDFHINNMTKLHAARAFLPPRFHAIALSHKSFGDWALRR